MSDDIIKKALGMNTDEPAPEDQAVTVYEGATQEDDTLEMDFDYICDNLKDLIAKGKDAISELILIAKQSQHPRAFEVIATLLKATADMNDQIMITHQRKAGIESKTGKSTHSKGVANVTNNNLFVGSTAELQAIIAQQKKKDD
jgi:hypothetical protein